MGPLPLLIVSVIEYVEWKYGKLAHLPICDLEALLCDGGFLPFIRFFPCFIVPCENYHRIDVVTSIYNYGLDAQLVLGG
ncbi:hypothetical protein RIR_jg8773.t1 [Rhizophagus irregularis DAOM 181602=DAOM 197198]|nr:hypothetical protein RIR_jg8773.t1 [Rhizophagus irregularis DAOM 181602=DAOM 197198]